MANELDIPLKALREKTSREVLRVSVGPDDSTHVTIDLPPVQDPAAWGLVFADLANHIANIYHVEKGADKKATVQRIAAAFKAEIESPTDTPAGKKE